MIKDVYETAQNADGSAQEELESQLESIEGRIARLTNSIQRFWATAIDSDAVKAVVDFLTNLVNLGTELVDTFGSLPILITGLGAAFSKFTGLKLFSGGGRVKNYSINKVNYSTEV